MLTAARAMFFNGSGGTMSGAVAVSCAAHVVAFVALQGQGNGADQRLLEPARVLVRSVSMVVPRQTKLPPPPVIKPPPPAPPPVVTKAPPPKPAPRKVVKRRRMRRRSARPAAPPSAAVPAPVAIAAGSAGKVAVDMPEAPPEPVVEQPKDPTVNETPEHDPTPYDLSRYGDGVHGALLAKRRYPEEARDLELEGEVVVAITVDRTGRLAGPARIAKSSGHKCLDREALRMVAAAAPFAALPDECQRRTAEFTVPIRFELEEDDEF